MSRPRHVFVSVPHGTSAGNMLRSGGLLDRMLESDPALQIVLLSPMAKDPQFVREFERPRVTVLDQPPHQPPGLEARLLAIVQASYLSQGQTESVRIRLDGGARQRHHPLAWTQGADRTRAGAAVHAQRVAIRTLGSPGLAPGDGAAVRSVSARCSWWRRIPAWCFPKCRCCARRAAAACAAWRSIRAGTTSPTS